MLLPGNAVLLRAFIGDDDTFEDTPLSDAILAEARRRGLAGASALRDIGGYGASAALHLVNGIFSQDLAVIVEIVDRQPKIEAFRPVLEAMMSGGLLTTQPLHIVRALQKPAPMRDAVFPAQPEPQEG